jgi:hypothetical protein
MPFDTVPEAGQVPENGRQVPRSSRAHVFHEDELGSNHANGSIKLPPESRAVSGKAGAFPGRGDVLAWESSEKEVNRQSCFEVDMPYVPVDRTTWKVDGEHSAAVQIGLALPRDVVAATLHRQVEGSDAGEERAR